MTKDITDREIQIGDYVMWAATGHNMYIGKVTDIVLSNYNTEYTLKVAKPHDIHKNPTYPKGQRKEHPVKQVVKEYRVPFYSDILILDKEQIQTYRPSNVCENYLERLREI